MRAVTSVLLSILLPAVPWLYLVGIFVVNILNLGLLPSVGLLVVDQVAGDREGLWAAVMGNGNRAYPYCGKVMLDWHCLQ